MEIKRSKNENAENEQGYGGGTLSQEKLIMLDSLLYYDDFAHNENGYVDVKGFTDDWEKGGCTSVINKMIPDDKNGMKEMVQRISKDSDLIELEIVSCSSSANMPQINAVCLMDTEKNVYFLYGGNYGIGDYDYDGNDDTSESSWQDNFVGAIQMDTNEQKCADEFFKQTMKKLDEEYGAGNYNNVILSGHSKGGNLAIYTTLHNETLVSHCLAVDAQGMSEDFVKEHQDEINSCREKITSIMPTEAVVGPLMYHVENETFYVETRMLNQEEYENLLSEGSFLKAYFMKHLYTHFPASLLTEKGELGEEGEQSTFSKLLHLVSVDLTDYTNEEDKKIAHNALDNIGIILCELTSRNPNMDRIIDSFLNEDTIVFICRSVLNAYPEPFEDVYTKIYYECLDMVENYIERGIEIGEWVLITNWVAIASRYGMSWEDAVQLAMAARLRVDPLILDIDNDGFQIESVKYGVHFDLNCDGFAEKINWTNQDAVLALDLNGNGTIDDGSEVFGDYHLLKGGTRAKNGFEALAQYDTNDDGIIDKNDEIFDKLRLWVDANSNGISEETELKTLSEMEIREISLNYDVSNLTTGTEALIGNTATFVHEDETQGTIGELWVASDLSDTIETVISDVSEAINGLPDVRSYGKVKSLHNAMEQDKTGTLQSLVEQFVVETDNEKRIKIVEQILGFLCNIDEVEEGSRGNAFSAKKLAVIEAFMGESFIGVNGTNPNTAAAPILENAYQQLVEMYCFAMIGSNLTEYLDKIVMLQVDEGKAVLDSTFFNVMVYTSLVHGNMTERTFSDICAYLSYFGANVQDDLQLFSELREFFVKNGPEYVELMDSATFGAIQGNENSDYLWGTNAADLIYGKGGNDNLNGGNGKDLLYGGNGDDIMNGGSDNDTLHGDAGNDMLDGGAGDDLLIDSSGDDTFVFSKGYGNDTITDAGGRNKIKFTGLNARDILVNGIGEYDVEVKIKDTGDTLIISDFLLDEQYADYELEFKDEKMHVTDPNSPFRHIYGGTGNDVLKAVVKDSIFHAFAGDDEVHGSDGEDIIYGNEGNDTVFAGSGKDFVFGGTGNDNLSGEEGDDILHAGEGDDILDGGSGNDVLDGGNGNDTYLFGKNYGTDTVNDSNGTTTVKLTDGLTLSDVNIFPAGEEVVICRKDTEDRLVLQNYAKNPAAFMMQTEEGTFAVSDLLSGNDGSVLVGTPNFNTISLKDEIHMAMGDESNDKITGNSGSDYLFGDSQSDTLTGNDGGDWIFGGNDIDKLYGNKGNDTLFGNKGKDELYGGEGDDCLDGGEEKDIMEGGSGNDTYFFRPGSGTDTILDQEGKNRILFGDGITKESLKAYRSGNNDLLLTFEGYQDTLILENYCIKEEARNLTLVFADGTVAEATDKDSPLRTIYGTAKSEYMKSFYSDGIVIKSGLSNDQLVGSEGDDILYGEDGNDRLTGNAGNDILDGGTGNDTLYGGAGDDTYIYKKGYGADTLRDEEGTSTIHIYDYNAGHVKAGRININDMALTFGDSGDKLIIDGFFSNEEARNFKLSFSGSSPVMATAPYSPLRTLYGTNGNDYMTAMDDNGVTLMGEKGVDHLNGGNGTDKLYGGEGNDHLHGHGGNDILDGGKGEDTLDGGDGNDTYLFHPGSGTDTIKDESGIHTILFGEGFSKENMTVTRKSQTDLQITFKDTKDKLVIQKYFTSKERRNISLQFADGSRFRYDDPDNPVKEIHAGNSNDRITAWDENGIILHGEGGNDKLNGAEGTDRLYGGTGNDKLYGHAGDDLLDGGTGSDTLNGGDGDDTYRFGTGYGSDIIEDNAGTGKVVFFDVASDAVTISRDKNANLLLTLKDTGDTLTIQDFETGNFTFEFADGVTGTIDSETAQWILTQPEETDPVQTGLTEEELIQANADLLSDLYTEDTLSEELFAQNDTSTLADTPDTVSLSEENKEVADQTDIQVMILTENMSAFGEEENVSAGIHISDISQDTSNTNQLFVDSLAS